MRSHPLPCLLPSVFSQLTMAFGIRNVPDRLKALKEFRRILAAPAPADVEPAEVELSEDPGAGGLSSLSPPSSSSVLAILELQNPETGWLASASRTFIKYVLLCFRTFLVYVRVVLLGLSWPGKKNTPAGCAGCAGV